MAYVRKSRSRSRSYSRARSGGSRGRATVGRRSSGGARRRSGGSQRQQTLKIVLQTVQAPATSSAFQQQVPAKPDRAKF